MKNMIGVTIKLLDTAADAVGNKELEYGLSPPAVLGPLIALLYAKHPKLAASADTLKFTVNGREAPLDTNLAEGDEVIIGSKPA